MKSQQILTQTFKSIAGSVLVAPGLFLLCGNLDEIVIRWNHLLGTTPGLGILSPVILAASVNPVQLLHGLLDALWPPLLLVLVGGILLWNASADSGTRVQGSEKFFGSTNLKAIAGK
jgi:hypothetical protein